ncbi:hypothetical protein [Halpernia sp.]|uniref:hypothetical protein n=1 Tax=Halpernia sp. TaxID=2782209 RepID=UPI003A946BDA
MKKIILLSAFGFAGLLSAKTGKFNSMDVSNDMSLKYEKIYPPQFWYWFTICGNKVAFIYDEPNQQAATDSAYELWYGECGPGREITQFT